MAPLELELLDLTNGFRDENGLAALRWHKGLAGVARRHAVLVAEGRAPFSHSGAPERFASCGTRCINVAENLARSDGFDRKDLPSAAVAGWCGSEGHRRNLLGPFDCCGIGWAAADSGAIFVTQLLALVGEPADSWRSRFQQSAATAASAAATSTPAVCAAAGLALGGGPLLALAGGLFGGALERRYGVRLARAPHVIADRTAAWLHPTTCASCGCVADFTVNELLATSALGVEENSLLCRACHPAPDDADNWCYLA